MIEIAAAAQRSFIFPAGFAAAFEYYADLDNTFSHLPHISLVKQYADGGFRMAFSTTELGIYRVRIYCDLQAEINQAGGVLRMKPLETVKAAKREAGLNSLSAPGNFASQSIFHPQGEQTRIDYTLDLNARLPVPLGLRFMPEKVVEAIARSITQRRFQETVDGFIERSLAAYKPGSKST